MLVVGRTARENASLNNNCSTLASRRRSIPIDALLDRTPSPESGITLVAPGAPDFITMSGPTTQVTVAREVGNRPLVQVTAGKSRAKAISEQPIRGVRSSLGFTWTRGTARDSCPSMDVLRIASGQGCGSVDVCRNADLARAFSIGGTRCKTACAAGYQPDFRHENPP